MDLDRVREPYLHELFELMGHRVRGKRIHVYEGIHVRWQLSVSLHDPSADDGVGDGEEPGRDGGDQQSGERRVVGGPGEVPA